MYRYPSIKYSTRAAWVFIGLAVVAFVTAGCGTDAQAQTPTPSNVAETATPQASSNPVQLGTMQPSPTPADPAQTPFPTSTATVSTPTPSATPMSMPPLTGRAEHPAGVSFSYPEDWQESASAVISTQFATDAECVSVRIIDREAPVGSGQAPFLYQSVVQVCSSPAGGRTLEAYMEETYGAGKGGFEPLQIGAAAGYKLTEGETSTAYFQNSAARFQVITSVVAEDPATGSLRQGQIQSILFTVSVD